MGLHPELFSKQVFFLNRFNRHVKSSACPKSYSEELQQNRKENDGCAKMSDENVLENVYAF